MSCSTCRGQCPTPSACHQPEPTPAPRARTYRPTYGVAGPYRAPGRFRRALRSLFPFLNR